MPQFQIESKCLAQLPAVYAVARWQRHERTYVVAASEARSGRALIIDPGTGSSEIVWAEPGGTMSFVPAGDRRFFAVQRFFPGFDSGGSTIVQGQVATGGSEWQIAEKFPLPYLHRLGAAGDVLIAATLCGRKAHVDDWTQAGAVYRFATSGPHAWEPVPVLTGIHRNHGFALTRWNQHPALLVSGQEGLFSIKLPGETEAGTWSSQQLLSHDVSDVVACDWDGDGEEELLTIEPFHGNRFTFYDRRAGQLEAIHQLPCELGHSLWAGRAFGKPVLILGERQGEGRILLLFPGPHQPSHWDSVVVASGTGGTNVTVLSATPNELVFVSANTDRNEVAWYRIAHQPS